MIVPEQIPSVLRGGAGVGVVGVELDDPGWGMEPCPSPFSLTVPTPTLHPSPQEGGEPLRILRTFP